MSSLAALMSLKVSSVSALLNPLEELGLISREHSTGDRRVVTLSLTQSGRDTTHAVSARTKDFITIMESNDHKSLESVLKSLEDIMGIMKNEIYKEGQ